MKMTESEIQAYIISMVEANQGILLQDLLLSQKESIANYVYRAIINGNIYVDLNLYPLAEPARVPVFSSKFNSIAHAKTGKTATFQRIPTWIATEPGTKVIWAGNSFEIVTVGEGSVWLQNENKHTFKLSMGDFESMVNDGEITGVPIDEKVADVVLEILKKQSPEGHKRALDRRDAIAGFLSGIEKRKPDRTEYRWLEKYRNTERLFGSGLLGLYDNNSKKGNKKPRLHEKSYELMDFYIETEYLNLEQPNIKKAYGHYVRACNAGRLYTVTYEAFRMRIKTVDAKLTAEKRKGKRSAYQLKQFYKELDFKTPRHGDRPFEIAHIDHTELDIELINQRTLENLGRPWLTLMIDAYSRRILAFYITFEPPSYRSCMNVLRICGIRHKCLPQILVLDNGKEFKSTYFETLLAAYEITKKERPPAQARFGSVVERMFGTTNTEFIHTLRGNTQIMKNVRQVTKSNNPKNRAVWNLGILTDKLSEYLYEVYDTKYHSGILESPKNAFDRGLVLFGRRRIIAPTAIQSFVFSTLPTTENGEATVEQSSGVKINYIYYHADDLNNQKVIGTKVPVKYDPFNLGHAYAFVNNTWVECISEYYAWFKDLTEKEYQVISKQLAEEHRQSKKKISVSSQKVAAFIASVKGTEKELLAQKLAEEQRGQLGFVGSQEKRVETEPQMPEQNIDYNDDEETEPDEEYQRL